MTLIAEHLNVSPHTVIRQLEKVGDNLHPQPTHLPEHLAVDEFKSVESVDAAMSCILMDNASHRIVDILEDRKQASLRQYFLGFSPEARQNHYDRYVSALPGALSIDLSQCRDHY
ncbi:Transposase [Ignavigranum ruoffiae]|uniref:Transposase n=1 Tax=Ignavigranum ruoffiae TaxID=89093 RepID=A0A1H9GB58_9LACT|nr:Transposase [Ignavigranum ruoffiae]